MKGHECWNHFLQRGPKATLTCAGALATFLLATPCARAMTAQNGTCVCGWFNTRLCYCSEFHGLIFLSGVGSCCNQVSMCSWKTGDYDTDMF